MRELQKLRLFLVLTGLVVFLPTPAFALLPPDFRAGWDPDWVKVILTIHELGVIFWIGGLGVRLLLLSAVSAETNEVSRTQFYDMQRRLFRGIEVPAFLLALVAGLVLVYSDVNTYQQTRFMVKMILVAVAVVVDVVALRQFDGLRATGKSGRASAFGLILVGITAAMLLASEKLSGF
jgi:uncharacterized membrane protein